MLRNFIHFSARGGSFCEGDFRQYYKLLITKAEHLTRGYHNFTHTLYVTWKCVNASEYYVGLGKMTKREARNLIIAAMFHDWNHSGKKSPDSEQIVRAVAAFRELVLEEDISYADDIVSIINATMFPHVPISGISLSQQLIREIDISQALEQTWIQQVLFGFAEEWQTDPITLLKQQKEFLSSLVFVTEWGKAQFEHLVSERIEDVRILKEEILNV